jgi:fibronectin type 3 domain-containing protein
MIEIDLINKPLTQFLWTAPVEREDGTAFDPGTEIGEYRIYWGESQGDYQNTIVVAGNTLYTDLDFNTLPLPLYLVMTAVDNDGRESMYSQESTFQRLVYPPKPPTGLVAL